jgi:diguanylate cyclase
MTKILAIDDDSLFLETVLDLLEGSGFQASGACNGLLGLELAKAQRHDLIICDIRMPLIDGYEVLKTLRQDLTTQTIPFIFLAAEQVDSDRNYAMTLGANDFVAKPCTISQLLDVIQTQLKSTGVKH